MPFPCRHLRPAWSAEKRELSIMIGSRAASGSVAIRFRNVVIACSASSRSASMLTSSRFAPPRTCSSATATAPWKSSASISLRNRAEPVTFVRSPTIDEPGVRVDEERLEAGEPRQLRRPGTVPAAEGR